MKVYIKSISHISVQKPLSEEWMTAPCVPSEQLAPVQEPAYSEWITPMAARRMAKVMKRAVVTSKTALEKAGLSVPDAIISATGLGCVDFTEKFLQSISDNAEEYLQPTFFMNSTHNTISSQIALTLKCHGYNNTWSHGTISFQSALFDGFTSIRLGKINNALIGGFDEMTRDKFAIFNKIGFWDGSFSGETALSSVISSDSSGSLCEIAGMDLLFRPSQKRLTECLDTLCQGAGIHKSQIDLIVTPQKTLTSKLPGLSGVRLLEYEPIFGRSFTSSAAGYHVGAVYVGSDGIRNVLVIDGDGITYFTMILLK